MEEIKRIKVKLKNNVQLTNYEKEIIYFFIDPPKIKSKKQTNKTTPRQKLKLKPVKKPRVKIKKDALIKRANQIQSKLVKDATKHEKIVAKELDKLGVEYSFQHIFIIKDKMYFSDFYIPSIKLTIEIDGFHHFHDPQKAKDNQKSKALNSQGVKTMRFKNDEIDKDIHLFICTIKRQLKLS